MPRKISGKVKNTVFFGPNYVLLIVFALLLGLLIIFWSVKRPFCANSNTCKESFGLKIENGTDGVFNGVSVSPPEIHLSEIETEKNVLGVESVNETKHIYVDLATQTLKAYEGSNLFLDTYVSTGKWFKTPTGNFKIWHKVRATRMSGGSGDGFYDLPNVPYVMFFEGKDAPAAKGYGLHGAYWHNNFGYAMSHGCVNMRPVDAGKLFNWAELNTEITIYDSSEV